MDDRGIVAAIAAGDLAGLADAFDQYAESLYGYCRWLLPEPAEADDALQETFVIAAARLDRLQDPRKLHPWLYAVARNQCRRRAHAKKMGGDQTAGLPAMPGDPSTWAERAELRREVQAALAKLSPDEREVLELELRHDLHAADLAAVLGVSRHEAHTLTSSAREKLDQALGALLVARTGREACPDLDALLIDRDGRRASSTRKQILEHAGQCEVCDSRKRGTLRPALLFGMAPLAALPLALRREVLRLCADGSQATLGYRHQVTLAAGPFSPNGFPATVSRPRSGPLVSARVVAGAGIAVAIVSTGIVAALALGGGHAPQTSDAIRSSRGSGTASTAATTAPAANPGTGGSTSPSAIASATASQSAASTPSSSPTTAKPSPSHSVTTTVAPAPIPSTTAPAPTPTTLAPTLSPTTPAPTLTPTPTPSPTTASATPTATASDPFPFPFPSKLRSLPVAAIGLFVSRRVICRIPLR